MVIDRSYHPYDQELIKRYYLPGLTGPADIEELATMRQTRERVHGYASLFKLRAADKTHSTPRRPRIRDRVRALSGNERARIHVRDGLPGFDADLYLYSRPFLVTEEDPVRIAEVIERLLSLSDEREIVSALSQQLDYFDVGLGKVVAEFVEKRPPLPMPLPKAFQMLGKLFSDRQEALADALIHLKRPDSIPEGLHQSGARPAPSQQTTRRDPVSRCAHLMANGIGLFLAELGPFWCHRSEVALADIARHIGAEDCVESHATLLSPVYDLLPEAREMAGDVIREHYSAGGVVPADRVPRLLQCLGSGNDLTGGSQDPRLHATLVEVFTFASRAGLGVAEIGDVCIADEGGMP